MMTTKQKAPSSAATLTGPERKPRGNRMTDSNAKDPFPFTFSAGRDSAWLWFQSKPFMSLGDWREARWRSFGAKSPESRPSFDAGFERGIIDSFMGAGDV